MRFRLTLKKPHEGQDNFFLWAMVILPIFADAAYIYDAYHLLSGSTNRHCEGLFSTILIVFTYMRYCAPIESRRMLGAYYVLLCVLYEVGTIGYLISYIQHNETYDIILYFGWGILEIVMTGCLIYYRVVKGCQPNFPLESKHLFAFITRLEIILAIYIPFFFNIQSITLTKHSIAFFLLFEFFAESYHRFEGFWIKATLYLFVCTVTVCVACEWLYLSNNQSNNHNEAEEVVASVFEFVSGCLCDMIIIFQFIPYHFKPEGISDIARTAFIFQQEVNANSQENGINSQTIRTDLQTMGIIPDSKLKHMISENSVIDLFF
jgi:hypothetical protein